MFSACSREVVFEGKYLGWKCPKTCVHPGITRSDACVETKKFGCIYLKGTGNLDPILDSGKRFIFRGILKRKNNVPYVEVLEVRKLE
jgi:predicted RNA-binding Zn-ribbon protein involved in translation (DUF1610 family)